MSFKLVQLVLYLWLQKNIQCLSVSHRPSNANGSGSSLSLLELSSLCPYNKFCTSSPVKEISRTDQEPCCERCSCDYDCHETGRCCPDMYLAGIIKPKYPCIHVSDLGTNQNSEWESIKNDLYHVITDCTDMERAVSYPKCYLPRDIQDFVIVSDIKTGKVYRNKHCAECNDVQNYVSWKLIAYCRVMSPLFYLEDMVERDKYLMENCTLSPVPPDGPVTDMSYCVPDSDVIKICNLSGKWDLYDKEIEQACTKNRDDQNTIFTEELEDMGRNNYYASVYCYLCNVAKNSKKSDICKSRRTEDQRKSNRVSLTAVLDLKIWEDEETQDFRCKSTDLWDPFKVRSLRVREINQCNKLVNIPSWRLKMFIARLLTDYIETV